MTEQPYNAAREREEIASRVASFKATQEKFEREREEYFVTTLQNARSGSDRYSRHVRGSAALVVAGRISLSNELDDATKKPGDFAPGFDVDLAYQP